MCRAGLFMYLLSLMVCIGSLGVVSDIYSLHEKSVLSVAEIRYDTIP